MAIQGVQLGQGQHQQHAAATLFPAQILFPLPFPFLLPSLAGKEPGKEEGICCCFGLSSLLYRSGTSCTGSLAWHTTDFSFPDPPSFHRSSARQRSGVGRRGEKGAGRKEKSAGCWARLLAQPFPAAWSRRAWAPTMPGSVGKAAGGSKWWGGSCESPTLQPRSLLYGSIKLLAWSL